MLLTEVLALEVGSALAKSILKVWLKDASLAQDISSSIVDLLKSRTSDKIAQWRGQRQFEEIGVKVGESLLPIFEVEGAKLDEESRTAVALAVAETFNKSKISSELLIERNLEPTKLVKHVLAAYPTATQHFDETETALYQRIIVESCEYIVDIASQLPTFTERSFAEVLKREDQLLVRTDQILQEVQRMREQLNPMAKAARFELEYRRAIARKLDMLELFGTDVSNASRRHRLSVAYITLLVEQKLSAISNSRYRVSTTSTTKVEKQQEEFARETVPVDKALVSSHRLLIRGLAGSGKTTLLQWIAIRSASHSFEGLLSNWNDTLPFYISLRHSVQSGLPTPETFPRLVTPAIADTMPQGWAHTELASGRAIVLVDGLDEVPESQRKDVHMWLKELVDTYPKTRFIITSRPHAVEEERMIHEGFSSAELQPMELPEIDAFIDNWHRAVREELHEEEEKTELQFLAKQLKEEVRHSRSKRNLATNPLLCAMLCALNRDRRQQLPSDRIELYEACCKMLLEWRDKERRIELADYPSLNYRQKLVLLEDFAYWLIKNGWSEIELLLADDRFARKLTSMRDIPPSTSGADVRRLFVERSGIIRELVAGRIDFAHRTFQEYLAAYAALDEVDIGVLVQNANDDQWREVIILASGLATKPVREKLIQALITRGDENKQYRHQLHLLAVSCLETSIELGQEVKSEVERRLRYLVPPNNITDAKALASAGELAVPYLAKGKKHSASTTAACIRTLALIGSESALEGIEGYALDERSTVIDELLRSWNYFDRKIYTQRVLSQTFRDHMELKLLSSFSEVQYFTKLKSLDLSRGGDITDISPLMPLTQLTSLDLVDCYRVSDISPLTHLSQLTNLDLTGCIRVKDFSPLTHLTQLISLKLWGCKQIRDLSPFAHLTQLVSLDLMDCENVSDLSPLAHLTQLISLNLSGCENVRDLSPLAYLAQLTSLDLSTCWRVADLSPLAQLTQLTSLDLSYCRRVSNLSPLAGLYKLKELRISGISNQVIIPHSIKECVTS